MGILNRAAKELTKYYFPFTWRNKPSIESPINEAHLNHMEGGINEIDNRVVLLAADKADKADLANVLIDFEMSDTTGVMTFTRLSGEKLVRDTAMEKIALNCYLEGDNFVLELADGTKQTVSLAKFIDTYTFTGSDTIRMTINGKNVAADILDGKITLAKLEPTVISTIRQYTLDAQTAKGVAEQAASTAQGWAVGGTGFENSNAKYFAGQAKRYAVVTDEAATDNAQYYCQEAKAAAEQAGAVAGFDGSASTVSAIDTQGMLEAATGAQLLDTETYELGTYSNTTGNANASDNTYRWLQYIPVTAGNTIYFSKPLCVFYYDTNKTFVSCDESAGITQRVVPATAAFVRCRTFAADFQTFNHHDYVISNNPIEETSPTTVQRLLDAIARKVATELVSNSALVTQLAGYVAKSAIVQTESSRADMVPSSAYFKQVVDTQNSNLESLNNISKTTLIYRGQITGDLNDTSIITGFYRIEANNSLLNAPSGCSYCILVAFGPPHFVQMVIDTTGIRVRKRTGNPPAWGIWAVI